MKQEYSTDTRKDKSGGGFVARKKSLYFVMSMIDMVIFTELAIDILNFRSLKSYLNSFQIRM